MSPMVTSAMFTGFFTVLPWKMTSPISLTRRDLVPRSPSTQLMASTILLLPHPFGPTIQVTPSLNRKVVLFRKDLKPRSSSEVSFM
ncbi:MAG: hypothetical protein A4E57_03897 [Syntrophorhabdaceae bacterium PtaU1.Bin034]|nr:MAG: hypothetical protein A4E57_03897 [Syntrophorhabdaceae bacterium PtaU1.Bin034]